MNIKVKKFNQVLANGKSNYDLLKSSQMPHHLTSYAHEGINEIYHTVPLYSI